MRNKMKTYTLGELQNLLPEFIEEEYPKGETKDRGKATVAITLYTIWLRKRELKNEKELFKDLGL